MPLVGVTKRGPFLVLFLPLPLLTRAKSLGMSETTAMEVNTLELFQPHAKSWGVKETKKSL